MTGPLPRALYSAEETRRLDEHAITVQGIPGAELMERAGARAYRALRSRWPCVRSLTIYCGAGNNGGDGFVVGRLALADGLAVEVLSVGDLERLGPDAATMLSRYRDVGGRHRAFAGARAPQDSARRGLSVDALLGTGLSRPVRGQWRDAIDALSASGEPVLAIDIPSGLHADTGAVLGRAVPADVSVTFIGLKRGMLTGEGPALCGSIVFDALGVPAASYEAVPPSARRLDEARLRALPPRSPTAHKGTFGHVLVLGGEHGYSGAVRMAGEAAARAGAGLVSVGTRAEHAAALNANRPELMSRAVMAAADLEPLAARATVVAVGPGLGRGAWGESMLAAALDLPHPLVVDADGLNLLAERPRSRGNWVLTPHPAEAARLLGTDTAAVQADRFASAAAIAERYDAVCVLKGAGTVIAGSAKPFGVCSAGNPGLSAGGSGDVLTGVIAAFAAQGHELGDAAELGVCAHAHAADLAARAVGDRGMLAGDVLSTLRPAVNPG